jgi:hypothetical protein
MKRQNSKSSEPHMTCQTENCKRRHAFSVYTTVGRTGQELNVAARVCQQCYDAAFKEKPMPLKDKMVARLARLSPQQAREAAIDSLTKQAARGSQLSVDELEVYALCRRYLISGFVE